MKSRTQSLASIFLVWDQNPLIAMFLPFLMFSCGDILGGVLVLTGSIKGLYKKFVMPNTCYIFSGLFATSLKMTK